MDTVYVQIHDSHIEVNPNTPQEAQLAPRELRLVKKEYSLAKRQINEMQQAIRAEYTDEVRRRGSMMRGGGGLGKFVRTLQSYWSGCC